MEYLPIPSFTHCSSLQHYTTLFQSTPSTPPHPTHPKPPPSLYLALGIISTPLPALITLQDDPLRLLRAVRFACRFFFDITPELLTASTDATVRVALGTKVTLNRITLNTIVQYEYVMVQVTNVYFCESYISTHFCRNFRRTYFCSIRKHTYMEHHPCPLEN